MNSKTTLRALFMLLATLVVTTQPSSAIAPDKGPNASGEGQVRFGSDVLLPPQPPRTIDFSFHAKENKNGKARGWARFDNLSTQTQVVVKIDCANIRPFVATMSGTVQHSDDPAFPVDANVVFTATDSHPIFGDSITPLIVTSFDFGCEFGLLGLRRLDFGDIRIEP